MVAKYFCAKGRTASLEKFQATNFAVDAHYLSGHKWLSGHEYKCKQISNEMDTQRPPGKQPVHSDDLAEVLDH